MLDSGADVSLIPTHLVNRECLSPPSSNNVFAANDTEIVVDLAVVVEAKCYSATFPASVNVDEVILGRDWLTQNQVVRDFHSDSVLIDGQKVDLERKHSNSPRCKRCRVGSDLEIPPLAEAVIPAHVIYCLLYTSPSPRD